MELKGGAWLRGLPGGGGSSSGSRRGKRGREVHKQVFGAAGTVGDGAEPAENR